MNPYITNIDSFYQEYYNPKYVNKGWAIVFPSGYEQYKDSKILYGRKTTKIIPIVDNDGNRINSIQHIVCLETKNDYRLVKYSSDFLAVKIAEREYDLIKDVELWAIKKKSNLIDNLSLDQEPPEFKLILNILNWKMTKINYNNIELF